MVKTAAESQLVSFLVRLTMGVYGCFEPIVRNSLEGFDVKKRSAGCLASCLWLAQVAIGLASMALGGHRGLSNGKGRK